MKNNKTKQAIIETIANESGISLKEIHNKIKKDVDVSYQAIHKATNELLNDEIIEKIGNEYQINEKWIDNLKNFISTADNKNNESQAYDREIVSKHLFKTFAEAGKFTLRFFDEIPNPTKEPGVCICKHSWPLFGATPQDYALLQKILKETTYYELIENETALDKAFGEPLSKLGKIIQYGKGLGLPGDTIVKGEHILQIIYSPEFEKRFDEIFNKYTKLEDLPVSDLIEEFSIHQTNISTFVIKDRNYADKLKSNVLKKFKK